MHIQMTVEIVMTPKAKISLKVCTLTRRKEMNGNLIFIAHVLKLNVRLNLS